MLERLRRRGILLNQGGILLRDLVHLREGLVNLLNTGRLLGAGPGNVGDGVSHILDRFNNLIQGCAGFFDEFNAVLDLVAAIGNQVLNIFGGLRRALGEVADLRRYNSKATAGLASACRLDSSIEREQIGLPLSES